MKTDRDIKEIGKEVSAWVESDLFTEDGIKSNEKLVKELLKAFESEVEDEDEDKPMTLDDLLGEGE